MADKTTLARQFQKVFIDLDNDAAYQKWILEHKKDLLSVYGSQDDEHGELWTFKDGSACRIKVREDGIECDAGTYKVEMTGENNPIQ